METSSMVDWSFMREVTGTAQASASQLPQNLKPRPVFLWDFKSWSQVSASEFGVLPGAGSPILLWSLAEACLCLLWLLTTPQGWAPSSFSNLMDDQPEPAYCWLVANLEAPGAVVLKILLIGMFRDTELGTTEAHRRGASIFL